MLYRNKHTNNLMETLKTILILVIGLPIGLTLTAAICLVSSLLWLIYLPWKLYNYIFVNDEESIQSFEEFIYACYGLGGVCTAIPLITVLGDETID